jgi:hypothetical protein
VIDIHNRRAKQKHARTKFYGAVSKEATERQWVLFNNIKADAAVPNAAFRVMCTLLLGHYNKHIGPDFERCNPGTRTIARESGLSRSHAIKMLDWLEMGGWLNIKRNETGGGSPDDSNDYIFRFDRVVSLPVQEEFKRPRSPRSNSSRAHLVDEYDVKNGPERHSIRRVAEALGVSHTTVRRARERNTEEWNMHLHVPVPVPATQTPAMYLILLTIMPIMVLGTQDSRADRCSKGVFHHMFHPDH